jgi:hypothetical protein
MAVRLCAAPLTDVVALGSVCGLLGVPVMCEGLVWSAWVEWGMMRRRRRS